MSAEGLNLEAISAAIDKHDNACSFELIAIFMCAFEVERLGWEEFRGIPIKVDPAMQSGRFRLQCENDIAPRESIEAVSRETVSARCEKRALAPSASVAWWTA